MTKEQELTDKMKNIGYTDFDVIVGEEQIDMLYVEDHLICSVQYALEMSEEALHALIAETVK